MKPVLQALLLADHVYVDKATGKKVVAGIFHKLLVNSLREQPAPEQSAAEPREPTSRRLAAWQVQQAGSPYAYISLTEIRGQANLILRFVSADTFEVFFETEPFVVKAKTPLDTCEIVVPIPRLPVKEGVYGLELHCDKELVGFHRVSVEPDPRRSNQT